MASPAPPPSEEQPIPVGSFPQQYGAPTAWAHEPPSAPSSIQPWYPTYEPYQEPNQGAAVRIVAFALGVAVGLAVVLVVANLALR